MRYFQKMTQVLIKYLHLDSNMKSHLPKHIAILNQIFTPGFEIFLLVY